MSGRPRTAAKRRRPNSVSGGPPGACRFALLAAIGLAAAGAVAREAVPAAAPDTIVTVRTLVIDALGTRAVDADVARIPWGGTGLLMKTVPYAGPPLSFRLAVRVEALGEPGVLMTLSADVWPGGLDGGPSSPHGSHRQETTELGPDGSYLLELDHDPAAERRIVLSLVARPAVGLDLGGPAPESALTPVEVVLEVQREQGGRPAPAERHLLKTLLGRPVSVSSSVAALHPGEVLAGRGRSPGAGTGLVIEVTPERAHAGLVTVRVRVDGEELLDGPDSRIEPISHSEVHTVHAGTTFFMSVSVPAGTGGGEHATGMVTYRVAVTPRLG